MSTLFKKLNLKDQEEILILNSPESFEIYVEELVGIRIWRDLQAIEEIGFVLTFVTTAEEIERLADPIAKIAPGDSLVWFAYPKTTSKQYDVQINRDRGWSALEKTGFRAIRQVSIDQDWSALRFRRKTFVGK